MRIFFLSLFLFPGIFPASAQSEMFLTEWAKTERTIAQVDSACSRVNKQSQNFLIKKSELDLNSPDNLKIRHYLKVKYKKGNIVARHIYKLGTNNKVKVLTVNGQIVMIRSKYHTNLLGPRFKNNFMNLGNKNWIWTHGISNDVKHPITESVSNWR